MSVTSAVADPQAGAAAASLLSGEVFVSVADDRPAERAACLEAVLDAVVDDGTRVVWVGNPLRSPLTVERFLLQVAGPEVDLRFERSPAELARLLACRTGSEARLLIVVQQPETINPETFEQLGALAGHLGGEAVQVQFLFVGTTSLRLPEVARAELAPLRPLVAAAEPAEPTAGSRRRDVLPLALLLIVVVLGVVVSRSPPQQLPLVPATAPATVPGPATATVPAPATAMAELPAAAPQMADDVDALRRQFDRFLAERAGSLPALSAAQKDALFNEFLTHHRRE